MSSRDKPRLDYKILNETGRRVFKSIDGDIVNKNMAEENLDKNKVEILNELKICEDIRHSLDIYEINDLDTEDEINEGLVIISDLSQNYRHAHVVLKSKLDDAYKNHYPDYDDTLANLTNFIKNARKRLKSVKKEKSKTKVAQERVCREDEEKNRKDVLEVEEDVLMLKITQLKSTVDINLATDILEVENYIVKMEAYMFEYFDLSVKFKICYGEEGPQHMERINLVTREISQEIKMAKLLKQKLIEVYVTKKKHDSEKKKNFHQNLKAENLSDEISLRCDSLQTKYEQKLENLSDYQILEISQNKSLDVEFNGVLEKVTDLAALVVGGGDTVQKMLVTATDKRDLVASQKINFQQNLQKLLTERDISPDKLKNASTLQIELPKFSGYDCKIDFYTFKTEFQKLVEPTVQKKYWADFLKRNYLCGSAFTLVEKENDYSKIWERLLESYGNARLLLQNKLGELDKIGGLWKIRGEEKIANALASLVNAMKDLSFLATEHNIEGQLYEGGGLEKVMILIGNYRHRQFRSQNLSTVSKKAEWVNLLNFLKQELQLRERMVLDNKTAKLMGFESKNEKPPTNKNDKPKNWGSTNYESTGDGLKCHFCEEEGHTIITTIKGHKIIPYYVCEKFVNLSASERFAKLKSKNLCTQCLFPGAIKGPKHKCLYLNFCCPHASHKSTEKPHVLLCGTHKNEAANLSLLEKFKERFIKNCKVTLPQYSKGIT